MRATNMLLTLLLAAAGQAQVLAPAEIRDPQLRALQQKYWNELKLIAQAGAARNFPYHFYFSRRLDLDEKEQRRSDQRSIQFDRYQGKLVLKITANYFVSYSTELIEPEERAHQTYQAVILPLLRTAVYALEKADVPQAFALEVSHHVRKKVLGVSSESAENLVLVLPKAAALRLVSSSDPKVQEAAVLEGEVYLNANPISWWPRQEQEIAVAKAPEPSAPAAAAASPTVSPRLMRIIGYPEVPAKAAVEPLEIPPAARENSPQTLKDLQESYQSNFDRMVSELESQAHFVKYAPPSFFAFHHGVYLQLSLTTILQAPAGSQYRLAALAFDQHIAHLIRPVLAYFRDRSDFDGFDFSTTVRLTSEQGTEGSPLAVEFIFPRELLGVYADYDSTGQQLIDRSFVLINGERVSLSLETAEAQTK